MVRLELVVTAVPSAVAKVPPLGTAVTEMVKLLPSASVGVVISRAVLVASSSMVRVLSAAATGALLAGGGWTIGLPPPPPPQADKVSEANAGQVIVFVSRLDCRFLFERILLSSPVILDSLLFCGLCFFSTGNRIYLDCRNYNISIFDISQNYIHPC